MTARELGRGLRALVLDDEDVVRMVVQELLEEAGFEVTTCETLSQALSTWQPHQFDLTMIDKNLPDGTGLDLAKRIAEAPGHYATLIMTGYSSIDSAVEAIRLDVDAYLVKPFGTLEEVLAQVERALGVMLLKRRNDTLVDELRQRNEELQALVVRDPVTQLFNHQFLQESVERELLRSVRYDHELSIVLADIDGFAHYNEERGHAEGDRLLRSVADIIQSDSRASDLGFRSRDTIVGRLDTDVYALVLPETPKSGAAAKGEKLRQLIEDSALSVTLSTGVATFPIDADNRTDLLDAARHALRAAKRGGRNRVVSFTPALADARTKQGEETEIERLLALDASITSRAFEHAYQPIVRAGTGEVFAYECLCRPTDARFPSPYQLFMTAAAAGRVRALGRVVRLGAMQPLSHWPEQTALFVNLHPLEIVDGLFEDEPEVVAVAKHVVLEVTESAEIRDFAGFRRRLDALRALGFRIAVDDLGAGYAGLNSLARLEPDFVKLDMELVRGLGQGGSSARLVKHIVEYANGEGITTIAEGVETEDERARVEELSCPLIQGYLFGRPEAFTPTSAGADQDFRANRGS